MTSVTEIDITLVATHRPDLLAITLDSFAHRIFAHFRVRRVVANIDPILGTDAEGDRCESLIRGYFPEAEVVRPKSPSFGQAVKTVWGMTGERLVLHMEDDWRALDDVTPDMVLRHMAPGVGMVMLSQKQRGPAEPERIMRMHKLKFLGMTLTKRQVNGYGTSPRFIAGGVAARFAELLIPQLDPEKQVLQGRNPRLSRLQQKFGCIKIWSADSEPLIEDLGRDWLRTKNIRKITRKSEVYWADQEEM